MAVDIHREPLLDRGILPATECEGDQVLIHLGQPELPVEGFIPEDLLE
jgi:hypothetical protein